MKSTTQKIRLANSIHHTAIPFNLLRGLDFIDYQENLISENARRLHEREVDLALIPSTEYALHGGYTGLDYGVACHKRSDLVMLYATQEIKKIQTVFFHQKCGSTPLLLKLLLKARWKVFPRFIKATQVINPEDLGPTEALLVIHDQHVDRKKINVAVAEDVIKLWYDWVGLPFVFLIWSLRPGTLNADQYSRMNEVFAICDQVRETELSQLSNRYDLPFGYLSRYEPDRDFYYKLGPAEHEGLNTFFKLCAEEGLLPEQKYQSSKLALLSRKELSKPKPVAGDILENSLGGQRLSIAEAVLLSETGKLEDLALTADLLRARLYSECTLKLGSPLRLKDSIVFEQFVEVLDELLPQDTSRLEVSFEKPELLKPDFVEKVFSSLKQRGVVELEALSCTEVYCLCKKFKIDTHQLFSSLATLGLDYLGGADLLDLRTDNGSNKNSRKLSFEVWSNYVQVAHRYGLASELPFKISRFTSWEQAVLFLQKVRFLQDLTGKVSAFVIDLSEAKKSDAGTLEKALRFAALTRIYLDNVATIRVRAGSEELGQAVSLLNAGCNSLYFIRPLEQAASPWKIDDFIRELGNGGLRLRLGM